MNGQPIYSPAGIDEQMKNDPNDPIKFQVWRNGVGRDVLVTPEKPISPSPMPKEGPQTDIGIDDWDIQVSIIHPTPIQQVRESVEGRHRHAWPRCSRRIPTSARRSSAVPSAS